MEHLKTMRDKNGKDYQDMITRLNRIEGQVRGVKKMLEEDRYCVDILTRSVPSPAASMPSTKSSWPTTSKAVWSTTSGPGTIL